MVSTAWTDAGEAQFVSLGTYRRTGELVETPVWVARSGDDLVVVTSSATGKAKRLRRDPRAQLRVCSRSGEVAAGTPVVAATGAVAGPTTDEPEALAALRAKYGAQLAAILGLERLLRLVRRRDDGARRVILRLSPRED